MAKRKFEYDSSDEEPWVPAENRANRCEQKLHNHRAMKLAQQLAERHENVWEQLPIETSVLEALQAHQRIRSAARGARRRELARIAGLLREADHDELQAALNARRSPREEAIEALVRWRTRIQDDLHAGLSGFLEQYPDADRQRIRQAAAQYHRSKDAPKRARANRALLDALKEASGW